jgi:acyl carrier protein
MVLPGYPFAKERYWIDDEDIDGGRIVNAWRSARTAVASKEPRVALPVREPSEEWLLSEQWVPLALETAPGSWRERVRARSGDDILVVSAEREIFSAIDQLCRGAEEILDHEGEMWRVEHAPIEVHADGRVRNFDLARHLRPGSTRLAIFLFLPTQMAQSAPAEELDIAFECVQRLSTHAAGRPVQFYCCHQDGGGEASVYQDSLPGLFRSAMLQHPTHRYRSIGVASEPGAADTLPLRAMREWLCDNTTEWPPADVPMVRYMGGRRLELRGSASSSARTAAMAAEATLNARIAAFERGEISKDEFGECLRGLEIDSLGEGLQQRIVQAIERVERMAALPASGGSPLQRIMASVEKVLGLKADAIDLDRPLQEYGMDSITTVRLTAALEKEFGITVPPRALLEHPSLNALAVKVGRDLGQMQLVS